MYLFKLKRGIQMKLKAFYLHWNYGMPKWSNCSLFVMCDAERWAVLMTMTILKASSLWQLPWPRIQVNYGDNKECCHFVKNLQKDLTQRKSSYPYWIETIITKRNRIFDRVHDGICWDVMVNAINFKMMFKLIIILCKRKE